MDEMGDTLATAFAGSDLDIQVVRRMTFNPTPPCIDIYPATPFRADTTQGFGEVAGEFIFTVRLRASTADNEEGQDVILAFMDDADDLSVATALEDDQTLNGLASSVEVDGPSGFVPYGDSGAHGVQLGCEWTVTVVRAES